MIGWRDLLRNMPDELTSTVVLGSAPPEPFIPKDWHNKKVAVIAACWAGNPADGEEIVRPLRALGTPIADLLGPIPYLDLQQLADPAWGPGAVNYFTSAVLNDLPDEAVENVSKYHRAAADPPVQAELHIHHVGGAIARVAAASTAFTDRTSPVIINCVARRSDGADLSPNIAWARAARDAMSRYGEGHMYVNFTGEGGKDNVRANYPEPVFARLQAVKDEYDPFNVFRLNLNIPPTRG
jgi:FAD/FMN-containing dehydrogenase